MKILDTLKSSFRSAAEFCTSHHIKKHVYLSALLMGSLFMSGLHNSLLLNAVSMRFFEVLTSVALGLIVVDLVDLIVFPHYQTSEEIAKGNLAAAIAYIGLMAIVVFSLVFGF